MSEEFAHQYEITGLTAERDWEKGRADRLETDFAALRQEHERLQRQVKIAVEALTVFIEDGYLREEAVKALAEIQKEQV